MFKVEPIVLTSLEIKRFWGNVDICGPEDCWKWKRWKDARGYGVLRIRYKNYRAHRVAFTVTHGDTEKIILHKCNNPRCCNPAHLSAGTHKENSQQAVRESRMLPPKVFGKQNGRSKLKEDDIRLIRQLRSDGVTCRELGDWFGVSGALVSGIATGKRWQQVAIGTVN